MKKSLWNDNIKLPEFEALKGEVKTDVLIIGGGIAGILCAYQLKKSGVEYILVEGDKIASGITENTTAKITFQHGLIYSRIIKSYGEEKAKMYLEANKKAFSEYEKICENIDCDYEKKDSYIYSVYDRMKIEEEIEALEKIDFKADFIKDTKLPFKVKGAVKFENQAQFNPLKFISAIASDLNIYENTFIKSLTPGYAIADNLKIKAKKIIIATHFPFINSRGNYFLKLYQHRSYVTAFENADDIGGMYADENMKGLSFRNYGKYLLIGGSGHRTGKKSEAWHGIKKFAKGYYPKLKPVYEWAAQDCISLDGIPYIGIYSKNSPDLYVASGFNKWGMTSSMVASMILRDMIMDKKNECSEVFLPQRSILKPQLFVNGFESFFNLITPTNKRCPHLGCALKWNKAEHTWDCPCHGSRFSEDGRIIDNPAMDDL